MDRPLPANVDLAIGDLRSRAGGATLVVSESDRLAATYEDMIDQVLYLAAVLGDKRIVRSHGL